LAGRCVKDAHVLNAASVRQPLAEAATRLRVEREVARIMGEGVRRIPPAADPIGERGVHLRRRCVDRGGIPYDKAGGGRFDHLAAWEYPINGGITSFHCS